ncbi:hypothetical protein CKQ90_36050, partial [Klebsiella pneumoniae]
AAAVYRAAAGRNNAKTWRQKNAGQRRAIPGLDDSFDDRLLLYIALQLDETTLRRGGKKMPGSDAPYPAWT